MPEADEAIFAVALTLPTVITPLIVVLLAFELTLATVITPFIAISSHTAGGRGVVKERRTGTRARASELLQRLAEKARGFRQLVLEAR